MKIKITKRKKNNQKNYSSFVKFLRFTSEMEILCAKSNGKSSPQEKMGTKRLKGEFSE